MENTDGKFAGWVILELMGHRRLGGWLSEQEIAGSAFLRIDIPSDPPATQMYSAAAVYCVTPTTEDMARAVAKLSNVAPVHRWELPPVSPPAVRPGDADYVDADIEDDDREAEGAGGPRTVWPGVDSEGYAVPDDGRELAF